MKLFAGRIAIDHQFCGGRPFFKGTRIPVYVVLEMLMNREKEEDILAAYPDLKPTDLTDAIEYAKNIASIPRQAISMA
ncbi:MAG: DUF433 domain-containing protein [Kiritimatiellia bacterium]